MPIEKLYLGDGLYASYDGFGIILTSENGIEILNRVYLEPEVHKQYMRFISLVKEEDSRYESEK